jgi:hypothetical protein
MRFGFFERVKQRVMFDLPKNFFAGSRKHLSNTHPMLFDNCLVDIDPSNTKRSRKMLANCCFAGAHQSNEHNVTG